MDDDRSGSKVERVADAEQEREGMKTLQRQPNYRSRALLDLARECPCMAQFPHDCSEYRGVEPAHSDEQIWGRGHSHKSHDFAFAACCHVAHLQLDMFPRDVKQSEWLRAHVKTMAWLWANGYLQVNRKGSMAA